MTACLPLPKAAGDPIPWGIITSPLPQIGRNKTIQCKEIKTTEMVKSVGYCRERMVLYHSECERKRNYQFTKIDTFSGRLGWCIYDEQRMVPREKTEWECGEANEPEELEEWDSAWTISILQRFQYGRDTPWCIRWTGKKKSTNQMGQTYTATRPEASNQEMVRKVPWWNCSRILDCDTDWKLITLLPVRVALAIGCACRGLQTNGNLRSRKKIAVDCKDSTVRSMGHFAWAANDGTWTTHLPLDGPVKEITMGLPTLCPI